jgi:hypothetical protein
MNVQKNKVTNLKATNPDTDYDGSKTTENVKYFNCLGSTVTNDRKRTHAIKTRIAMAKAAFNRNTLFISKLDLKLRKKIQCDIWIIALYGDETWLLLKLDQKYHESFEMWC